MVNTYPFSIVVNIKYHDSKRPSHFYTLGQIRIQANDILFAYQLANLDCQFVMKHNIIKDKDGKVVEPVKYRFFHQYEDGEYTLEPELASFAYNEVTTYAG